MLRRFVLPLILLVPLESSAPAPQVSAVGVSVLFASPSEGHPGDVIWLSGSGLQPLTQYYIFFGCPNWHDPTVFPYQNYRHVVGPISDANGGFVRFQLHAFQLHHLHGSQCVIYSATNTDTGFGPDIPAIYAVVPHGETLRACAVQICGRVTTSPKPAHSGQYATFLVDSHGWGGAFADVTISFNVKGFKPLHWSGSLDWNGLKHLRVRIPSQSAHLATASVSATFHLGRATGKSRPVLFTVVR